MTSLKKPTKTTQQEPSGKSLPRLPHEHDASHDSQADTGRDIMQQAFDDIESGQQDTDLHNQPGVEKPENFTKSSTRSTSSGETKDVGSTEPVGRGEPP